MRALLALSLFLTSLAPAREMAIGNDQQLRDALPKLKAGDTLRLAPGRYEGGHHVSGLHGTAAKPIVIEGQEAGTPPVITGGNSGLHIAGCAHLTLRHLHLKGQKINGLNLDDGGHYDTPARHITIENVQISEIGSGGNHDAIKLSGLDDFLVRGCTIEGWDGQAIDMVGCHRGVIEHCNFRGVEGRRMASGPQTKGGCEDIVIRHCRFDNAGGRPLQLGGSTGLPYFRPKGARYEARRITAHDNLILGGQCAVAFSSLDGGEFHHNTIVHPDKWVIRILQENNEPGFPPCRNVDFHHNLIEFERSVVRIAANVGANTEGSSFKFHHNLWFATDSPGHSEPNLPSRESGSIHGLDPKLDSKTFQPGSQPARDFGRRAAGGQ